MNIAARDPTQLINQSAALMHRHLRQDQTHTSKQGPSYARVLSQICFSTYILIVYVQPCNLNQKALSLVNIQYHHSENAFQFNELYFSLI